MIPKIRLYCLVSVNFQKIRILRYPIYIHIFVFYLLVLGVITALAYSLE